MYNVINHFKNYILLIHWNAYLNKQRIVVTPNKVANSKHYIEVYTKVI